MMKAEAPKAEKAAIEKTEATEGEAVVVVVRWVCGSAMA
jgi:hypothetical protein